MAIMSLLVSGSDSAAATNGTNLVINGTNYNLASAPAVVTTYGRYTVSCPVGVVFRLQLWGAGGGQASYGGVGGYAQGVITILPGIDQLLLVGQAGSSTSGAASFPDGGPVPGAGIGNNGWPGGGSSRFGPFYAAGSENVTSNAYYLIAGGGGGGHMYGPQGGAGGPQAKTPAQQVMVQA